MKKITIILFLWCGFLYAQHPMSIQLTQRDGLPDIEFYDLIEDKKGFIWLACDKGLYRYDGKEFKNYTHPEKKGLSVFDLQFDNQNRLWCTNLSGQFFYIRDDKLSLFFDAGKEFNREALYSFKIFDKSIVACYNGFSFKKSFTETPPITVLAENKSKYKFNTSLSVKNDTLFLLDFREGALIWSLAKQDTLFRKYCKFNEDRFATLYVNSKKQLIYQQRENSRPALKRGEILKGVFKKAPSLLLNSKKKINQFFLNDSKTWVLTQKGVEVFEEQNDSLVRINHFFENNSITDVLQDNQNNYWFSTLQNGVYVVPNLYVNRYSFRKYIGNITAIENVNNTHIYFGTASGWLGIYDIKNQKTNYIQLAEGGGKIRHILHNKKLNDVYVAHNNSKGNYIVDAITKKSKHLKDSSYYGGAKSLIFLNNDKFFSSHISVHNLINFSKDTIKSRKQIFLRPKRTYTTFFDSVKEQIYIAYIDNLIVYDKNFKPITIFYNNKPIMARGITQTQDGVIWVSTFKNGVFGIKNNKVVDNFTTQNGLLSNQTNYIKADGNNLWITTDKGLQLLNRKSRNFKNITQTDGVESFNINGIEIIGDIVWFSSDLGLFSFDKTKVFKSKKIVEPYFTAVTIADSTYTVQPNYTIKHDDKRIAIQFNANQFQTHKNTKYQYKLEGFQNNWKNVSRGVNEVIFNSLEKGNYTFKLRTKNGNRYSRAKEVKLKVKGVFYKQWWFFVLVSIIIVSYVIFYYKKRLDKQEKEQKLALQIQQNKTEKTFLKLENLRSQMNPHFVFNALNSIQDYIIHNQKDLAGDYLGKFADLIRMYLDQSSKKEISLFEEIDTLKRYLELEKLRFEDKLEYQLLIEQGVGLDSVFIPTMLIQPYVENSLKHGLLHKKGVGNLFISFKINKQHNVLTCIIIDDGVGRKKSKLIQQKRVLKHKSFATKATQERLDLLNYNRAQKISIFIEDLTTVENLEDTGTKVTIKIPV